MFEEGPLCCITATRTTALQASVTITRTNAYQSSKHWYELKFCVSIDCIEVFVLASNNLG
jgi:hypothetical protein